MNTSLRTELIQYVSQTYGIEPEYPWRDEPNYVVLRHGHNLKWFGVIMNVPKSRLFKQTPKENESCLNKDVDILNVKCEPDLVRSLTLNNPGFLPAYHMNHQHWVSILLDGTVSLDDIFSLLSRSYDLTS